MDPMKIQKVASKLNLKARILRVGVRVERVSSDPYYNGRQGPILEVSGSGLEMRARVAWDYCPHTKKPAKFPKTWVRFSDLALVQPSGK